MYFQIIVVHIINKIYQTYHHESIIHIITRVKNLKNALFDFKKFILLLQYFWKKKMINIYSHLKKKEIHIATDLFKSYKKFKYKKI